MITEMLYWIRREESILDKLVWKSVWINGASSYLVPEIVNSDERKNVFVCNKSHKLGMGYVFA